MADAPYENWDEEDIPAWSDWSSGPADYIELDSPDDADED